ncbi:MAG TPA: hypothetical protein VH083_16160 [Myxococcales bacterium]|jgi:hypothetical protein|nr:hypothetical protein [Myxococcales bacterium]
MTSFGLLVVDVPEDRFRGREAPDYLQELDSIPARELVLEFRRMEDELLPRVAAFVKYLGVKRSVHVCGLAANQIDRLQLMGVDGALLLPGRWPGAQRATLHR